MAKKTNKKQIQVLNLYQDQKTDIEEAEYLVSYLEDKNMEWNDGNVRQKPGKANSLGLVKFMFPNSNNIYLHDTPSKSLFNKESRAFSHGCVRVEKARDLASAIMDYQNKMSASF